MKKSRNLAKPVVTAEPFRADCPSRDVLELIGSKWSMLIICLLRAGPIRTGSLMRAVSGISQKMLTQTLRGLERSGVITRISYPEVPPRVEYALTELGQTLAVLVVQTEEWVVKHYEQVLESQRAFDASLPRRQEQGAGAHSHQLNAEL
jgi:DNA-binding HxlR family transcriptional regulator